MGDWQITVQWSRATDQGQLFAVQVISTQPESAFCSMLLPKLLGVLSCKNKILGCLCAFSMRSLQLCIFAHSNCRPEVPYPYVFSFLVLVRI